MKSCSKADIEKEILERLDKIAISFEKLSSLANKFSLYTKEDVESNTAKKSNLSVLLSSIEKEESNIFQELIEMKIDVENYFVKFALPLSDIKMVDMFKPYQIVSKYLNARFTSNSHDESAISKYYSFVYKQSEDIIDSNASLYSYFSIIKHDNKSFLSVNLILDLIRIWEMFLIHHTEIDISSFKVKINTILRNRSIYCRYVPNGLIECFSKAIYCNVTSLPFKEKEKKAIERDIIGRLGQIAFHYEEIQLYQGQLIKYSQVDLSPDSAKNKDLETLMKRIINQENDTLSELVHLYDNVAKYLIVHGLNKQEIDVIDQFKPFRIANNYVNTSKHGIRGKKKTSMLEYIAYVFDQKGMAPSQDDPITGIIPIVNGYNGNIAHLYDIINDLITVWEMFIRNHTSLDITSFRDIRKINSKKNNESVYYLSIPEGLMADAKIMSEERKQLEIS